MVTAVWGLVTLTAAFAEKPTLTRLFPPGAQRGQTVDVEATGKFSEAVQVWTDREGLDWNWKADKKRFEVTVAEGAEPGVVFVRIVDDEGATVALPFVISHLPETLESEPNDLLSQAHLISSFPQVLNGVLQASGDVDHYRVALRRGQTLVASVAAETDLASPVDTSLQIVSAAGHVLAQNLDYHNLDPQFIWTAENDCEVMVRVFGFPAAPNSTIALAGNANFLYRLTLTTGPFIEGVMPLVVSDVQPTTVRWRGWNLPADAITEIPVSTNSSSPVVFAQPNVPGVFRLPKVSSPILSLDDATADSPPIHEITLPIEITGNLHSVDQRDVFEFDGKQNDQWVFRLESRHLGYPLDAVLEVEEVSSGKRLAREDDTNRQPDPQLRWKVPADGRYRVIIADVNGMAYDNNLYRLSIGSEVPGYALTINGELFEGKVGEAIEIPIAIERIAGFAEPLEVMVVDAPDGLTCEPVRSETKGETAKAVKLKLVGTSPLNQPFRIVSRVLDQAENGQVYARTSRGLESFWLTIRKP